MGGGPTRGKRGAMPLQELHLDFKSIARRILLVPASQSFGRAAPRQLLPEKLVMAPQTEAIRLVQHHAPEQIQKVFGEFGLLIERIQLTANRSSGIVWIPGHSLPVKGLLFPPVADAGQNLAGLAPGDHLQEDAPAIALEVIAIEFEISVFVGRQCWFGGGLRCGTKMHPAHLALGNLGKYRMKWYHWQPSTSRKIAAETTPRPWRCPPWIARRICSCSWDRR